MRHENSSLEAGGRPAGQSSRPWDPPRILTEKECEAIAARVRAFARGGGDTAVYIKSWWQGELRWGRNRTSLMSDRRDLLIKVSRTLPETNKGFAVTNQIDDTSLEAAVRAAERHAEITGLSLGEGLGAFPELPKYPPPPQPIWNDATFNSTVEERVRLARTFMDAAEAKGMLSAGYLEVRAASIMSIGTELPQLRSGEKYAYWEKPYRAYTQAQCSLTVRDQKGTGSGWAGHSSYDLAKIDTAKLNEVALQKAIASQNPVALEPGRYTVILEPAAVAALTEPLVNSFTDRDTDEMTNHGVWSWKKGYSKLGLKIVDERISIWHDPHDPRLGVIIDGADDPGPITWVDRGKLNALTYGDGGYVSGFDRTMLMRKRYKVRQAYGYQMSGGKTSIEEMIRTTQRGLLVTRFSGISSIAGQGLVITGFTRDGLWLIENGKITKAVKNFRFAHSPVFMLNTIEQLGEPVPVFRPTPISFGSDDAYVRTAGLTPAVVPPLKVHDFNFTAMIDAV